MSKIGFCCKWIDGPSSINGIKQNDPAKEYNTGTTTVAWLKRQTTEVAEQKLWDLMEWNLNSIYKLVERVGNLDEHLRMVRLSSDVLPVYTEPNFSYFYHRPDVRNYAERKFSEIGRMARLHNVRLSFHPGQFTVLASDRPDVVERSIEEFEYHAYMAAAMGYGKTFQDFKINVHIAGRAGPAGIRSSYQKLSPEARNCITIENEENAWGLDDCLTLADTIPIVLDIHHHWIKTGEYIEADDPRVQIIKSSWRDVRPALHYSVSREDYMVGHATDQRPDLAALIAQGFKRQKLRAHSNFYWNDAVNTWAMTFADDFDIQCESKAKNLASFAFAKTRILNEAAG
jgi:UV DNA damage endonuclease